MLRGKPREVENGLRERIEPLVSTVERRFRHPGRKRLDDRAALCGILFVLCTGIPWEFLEQSIDLFHRFRRSRIRWEGRDDIHEAFTTPASAIICWRRLINHSAIGA